MVLGGGIEDGECSRQRDHLQCLLGESGVRGGHRRTGPGRGGPTSQGERYQEISSKRKLWLVFLNHSGCCGCVLG